MVEDTKQDTIEEQLPADVQEALNLVTALLMRVKAFLKRPTSDYVIWLAWFVAGGGMFGMIWFYLQFQLILIQLQQLQAGGLIWASLML